MKKKQDSALEGAGMRQGIVSAMTTKDRVNHQHLAELCAKIGINDPAATRARSAGRNAMLFGPATHAMAIPSVNGAPSTEAEGAPPVR